MLIGVHQQPKIGLKKRVVYYIEKESLKSVASVVSFWFMEKLHCLKVAEITAWFLESFVKDMIGCLVLS